MLKAEKFLTVVDGIDVFETRSKANSRSNPKKEGLIKELEVLLYIECERSKLLLVLVRY
jgi:hypothetical protein